MNGQEKANLRSSAALIFCFQRFVQSIHRPHLTAIKDNHRSVYVYDEDRYRLFGHCGSICWKMLGKLQLKCLIFWVESSNWRDTQWYEVPSAEQRYQRTFPFLYDMKQLKFDGWRWWAVYLDHLADRWMGGIEQKNTIVCWCKIRYKLRDIYKTKGLWSAFPLSMYYY